MQPIKFIQTHPYYKYYESKLDIKNFSRTSVYNKYTPNTELSVGCIYANYGKLYYVMNLIQSQIYYSISGINYPIITPMIEFVHNLVRLENFLYNKIYYFPKIQYTSVIKEGGKCVEIYEKNKGLITYEKYNITIAVGDELYGSMDITSSSRNISLEFEANIETHSYKSHESMDSISQGILVNNADTSAYLLNLFTGFIPTGEYTLMNIFYAMYCIYNIFRKCTSMTGSISTYNKEHDMLLKIEISEKLRLVHVVIGHKHITYKETFHVDKI